MFLMLGLKASVQTAVSHLGQGYIIYTTLDFRGVLWGGAMGPHPPLDQ